MDDFLNAHPQEETRDGKERTKAQAQQSIARQQWQEQSLEQREPDHVSAPSPAPGVLEPDSTSEDSKSDEDLDFEAAACWPFDASHFGSFWVQAAVSVVREGPTHNIGEGQVVAFDTGTQTFSVSIRGQGKAEFSRAELRFGHAAVIRQVQAFFKAFRPVGHCIWDLGRDHFDQQLRGISDPVQLDKTIALWQLVSLRSFMLNSGAHFDLPESMSPIARRLLDLKVTVDSVFTPIGMAKPRGALLLAALQGSTDLVRELLSQGVSPLQRAGDGSTALHFALAQRHLVVCHALLAARADPGAWRGEDAPHSQLEAPVHIAASKGFVSGLRLLVEHSADCGIKCGDDGMTPLGIAITVFAERKERTSPESCALRAAARFLWCQSPQAGMGIECAATEYLLRKACGTCDLAVEQRLAEESFGMRLWQTVFCWMLSDKDVCYGQEGTLVGCVSTPQGTLLMSEFAGRAFNFGSASEVRAERPPDEVAGFRIGEVAFVGITSEHASAVTVLGPAIGSSNEADIYVRYKDGCREVVEAGDLAKDRASILPFRGLEEAGRALAQSRTGVEVLRALDRLTSRTRTPQMGKAAREVQAAKRLRSSGAGRDAEQAEDSQLRVRLRARSDASVAALKDMSARLRAPDRLSAPVPMAAAIKGAKVKLHCARSLKSWLRAQLELEQVHVLLVRAECEPPSLAFPCAQEAVQAACRAASLSGDLVPLVEVISFCRRRSGAEQGLYQPILHDAVEQLSQLVVSEACAGLLFTPIVRLIIEWHSPSFREMPASGWVAAASRARVVVGNARESLQAALKALRKSHAGDGAISTAMEEQLREFTLSMDLLEHVLLVSLSSALCDLLQRPVRAQEPTKLRASASERAQIYEELARVAASEQAMAWQDSSSGLFSGDCHERFLRLAKNYRSMTTDKTKWTSARIREFFDLSSSCVQLVKGCRCGFRDTQLANTPECPNHGLRNHIDYPPPSCLPCDRSQASSASDDSSEYYFAPEATTPFRHWALVAEIQRRESSGELIASTVYDQKIRVALAGTAHGSADALPGCTLVILYPLLHDGSSDLDAHEFGMSQATYHLSTPSPQRVFAISRKIGAVIEASDLLAERLGGLSEASSKYGRGFGAVVAALLRLDFRSFQGYVDFPSLMKPQPPTAAGAQQDGSRLAVSEEPAPPPEAEALPELQQRADGRARRRVAAQPPCGATGGAGTIPKPVEQSARRMVAPLGADAAADAKAERQGAGDDELAAAAPHDAGTAMGGVRNICEGDDGSVSTLERDEASQFVSKSDASQSHAVLAARSSAAEASGEVVGARQDGRRRLPAARSTEPKITESQREVPGEVLSASHEDPRAAQANPTAATPPAVPAPAAQGRRTSAASRARADRPGSPVMGRTGCLRVRPSDIFFTHDSIGHAFKDRRPICETLRMLQKGSIRVGVIPELTVTWSAEGSWPARWWTYTGNRRLWVFRELEKQGVLQKIVVQVTDQKVPRMRLTTRNGGETVRVRNMSKQMLEAVIRPYS